MLSHSTLPHHTRRVSLPQQQNARYHPFRSHSLSGACRASAQKVSSPAAVEDPCTDRRGVLQGDCFPSQLPHTRQFKHIYRVTDSLMCLTVPIGCTVLLIAHRPAWDGSPDQPPTPTLPSSSIHQHPAQRCRRITAVCQHCKTL
jgi:hypothetical protein